MNKWIKKYSVLISFIGLSLVGLVIYFVAEDSKLWKLWGAVDISFAVALGVLAFIAYRDMVRDEDEMSIIFELPNGDTKDTSLTLLRKNCTRSEILGILGMIQKDPAKRFTIASLQTPDFLKMLNNLQKGTENKILIRLQEDEIEQFH
jgi:hypothetical protein